MWEYTVECFRQKEPLGRGPKGQRRGEWLGPSEEAGSGRRKVSLETGGNFSDFSSENSGEPPEGFPHDPVQRCKMLLLAAGLRVNCKRSKK